MDSAQANVDAASINLSYTIISAPINGVAGKANFREGALISPGPKKYVNQCRCPRSNLGLF